MKKSVYVLAILAVAVSTATAKDLDKKTQTNVAATKMTDAEMDKVTAGSLPTSIYNTKSGHYMNLHAWHACGHGPISCSY